MKGRSLRRILFCAVICASAILCCGDTFEIKSTDVPKNIPDASVDGIKSALTTSHRVIFSDLEVKLNITHTCVSDLVAYLIAPDGTRILLFSRVGGRGDNFENTIFDNEAATAITDGTAPFTGSFSPEGNLAVLYGKITDIGTWKLEVADVSGEDPSGTLNSWSLIITEADKTVQVLSDALCGQAVDFKDLKIFMEYWLEGPEED